jgi:hypothetical protein
MKLLLVFCLFDKLDKRFDIGVWNEKWDFMMHWGFIDATVINVRLLLSLDVGLVLV